MRKIILLTTLLVAISSFAQRYPTILIGMGQNSKSNVEQTSGVVNQPPTITLDSAKSNSGRVVTNDTIYTTDTILFHVSASDPDGFISRVSFSDGAVDTTTPYVFALGYQGVGGIDVSFSAVDDKERFTTITKSYALVDTTINAESGTSIDTVEAENFTVQAAGSIRTSSRYSNDTVVTQNSSHTHYYITNFDVDSINIVMEAAQTDCYFRVLKNNTVVDIDTTTVTGTVTFSYGGLGMSSGDTIKIDVTNAYTRHDFIVLYGSGYDVGDPIDKGDDDENNPPPPPVASCSDSIQNQNETGIDCGGVCPPCTAYQNFTVPENELWDYPVGYLHPDSNYLGFAISKNTLSASDTIDNRFFYIYNDSVWTKTIFNREARSKYTILLYQGDSSTYRYIDITIADVSGVRDEWRFVDAIDSAKYATTYIGRVGHKMRTGDWIFMGDAGNGNIYVKNDIPYAGLRYPNKIWILGQVYGTIQLWTENIVGNDTTEPVYLVPFGGQVESIGGSGSIGFHVTSFQEATLSRYINMTGKRDTLIGIGSPYYAGCDKNNSTLDFTFSRGTFGFWEHADWKWEKDVDLNGQTHGIRINAKVSDFWLSYAEISDGWFSGLNFKFENIAFVSEGNKVTRLSIKNISTEGIYSGSTKSAPQQFFNNMTWVNILSVYTGQAYQFRRMTESTTVKNVMGYGGFDWKSPFQGSQDGGLQAEGGENFSIINGIFLGSGKGGTKYGVNTVDPVEDARVSGTQVFRNNLRAWGRGNLGFYISDDHDNRTSLLFENNYIFKWGQGTVEELYPNLDMGNVNILDCRIAPSSNVVLEFKNNFYDNTFTSISRNNNVDLTNNTQTAYVAPSFRNALGTGYYNPIRDADGFIIGFSDSIVFGDDFDYTKIERYTNILGSDKAFTVPNSNKNQPAVWEVGDVVQYWNGTNDNGVRDTRFYHCVQAENSSTDNRPPTSDFDDDHPYWRLLFFKKPSGEYSYFPPDDWRLEEGSFYDLKNMGLQESADNEPYRVDIARGGIMGTDGSVNN